jgi:hypothetical protein
MPGVLPPGSQHLVRMEEAMSDWRMVAIRAQPMVNADYIRTVCEEIVRRAEILSRESTLRFEEVAGFLLTRTRAWVLGGLPVTKIGEKLPKNLHDLGMLKLAEGSITGGPLTDDDINAFNKPRIIR